MEIKANGRFVKVSKDEMIALESLIGQRFVEVDGIRRSVTIHLWQGQNTQRLYVKVDGDSSYVKVDANQDEFGFSSPISGRAVVALLNEKQAEKAAKAAPQTEEAIDDDYAVAAPTVAEAQEAMDIVGFKSVPASETDAVIRTIQIKGVWQHFVIDPLFLALPEVERRPYRYNEICLEHDAEFDEILKAVRSGLISWGDHIAAFRQGVALRAI